MKCHSCGEAELVVTRETIPYRSLPGVMLAGIDVETCPACGERLESIPSLAGLNHFLAAELVRKTSPLTGDEIRFLRKSLGWSGRDLAARLKVDPATVSRWESGRQQPGPQVDLLIRFVVRNHSPVEHFEEDRVGLGDPQPLNGEFTHEGGWKYSRSA